jgi:hypothetical protein
MAVAQSQKATPCSAATRRWIARTADRAGGGNQPPEATSPGVGRAQDQDGRAAREALEARDLATEAGFVGARVEAAAEALVGAELQHDQVGCVGGEFLGYGPVLGPGEMAQLGAHHA